MLLFSHDDLDSARALRSESFSFSSKAICAFIVSMLMYSRSASCSVMSISSLSPFSVAPVEIGPTYLRFGGAEAT